MQLRPSRWGSEKPSIPYSTPYFTFHKADFGTLKAGSTYCLSLKVKNRGKRAQQLKIKTSWKGSEVLQLVWTPGELLPGNDRRIDVQLAAPKVAGGQTETRLAETLWVETDRGYKTAIELTATVLAPQVWRKGQGQGGNCLPRTKVPGSPFPPLPSRFSPTPGL